MASAVFSTSKGTISVGTPITTKTGSKKYTESYQSANTLFHFVDKLEYLEEILKEPYIYPRYCEEKYSFLPDKFPSLIFPMRCFCDIFIEKLTLHCADYGGYGIGFDRDLLIDQGVQSVQYINENSDLRKNLSQEAAKYLLTYPDMDKLLSYKFFQDNLFYRLKYSKPIQGNVKIGTIEEHPKFLPDEKEWRFVPQISSTIGVKPFLNLSGMGECEKNIEKNKQSDALKTKKDLALEYKYEKIKYIIAPGPVEKDKLIEFIWNTLAIKENIKLKLISNIITLNIMEGDM